MYIYGVDDFPPSQRVYFPTTTTTTIFPLWFIGGGGRHLQPKKPHGIGSGASASGGPKNHLHLDLLGGELDQKLAGSPMAELLKGGGG